MNAAEKPKPTNSNLTPNLQKALKDLKNLERDKGIIMRPYDKGTGFVLRYKEDYKKEMEKELSGGTFGKIVNAESAKENCIKRIKGWVKQWRETEPLLTNKVCNWITPTIRTQSKKLAQNCTLQMLLKFELLYMKISSNLYRT